MKDWEPNCPYLRSDKLRAWNQEDDSVPALDLPRDAQAGATNGNGEKQMS